MNLEAHPVRRPRRFLAIIIGLLTLTLNLVGASQTAHADDESLSGQGSAQQTLTLAAGHYMLDVIYNTSDGSYGGLHIGLTDEQGDVDEVLHTEGVSAHAWSYFWVPTSRNVTLKAEGPATVGWMVSFVRTEPPTPASTGVAGQGLAMGSLPIYRLGAGSYELSLSYQNSRFADGSVGFLAYVSGDDFDSFWLVVDDEDESASYTGGRLELTKPGNVWVTIAAAGPDASWTFRMDRALASSTPTISGTLASGSTVKAVAGDWSKGTKLSYQWLANGSKIKGATKSSLKLTSSLKGKKISVRVTGKKSGYPAVVEVSKATAKVATAATPKVKGTAKVGKTLEVLKGSWTKGTKFGYQWLANGSKIEGATKSSLKLTSSLKGKKITVRVTGEKSGYATVTKTSKATKKVAGVKPSVKRGSGYDCPPGYPVKGNADSMIYHMPGDRYYKATKPEECFRSAAAARSAGYRRAKV
ncbi:MAG: hypothetical protein QM628_09170 [Propionicimonas sp.]